MVVSPRDYRSASNFPASPLHFALKRGLCHLISPEPPVRSQKRKRSHAFDLTTPAVWGEPPVPPSGQILPAPDSTRRKRGPPVRCTPPATELTRGTSSHSYYRRNIEPPQEGTANGDVDERRPTRIQSRRAIQQTPPAKRRKLLEAGASTGRTLSVKPAALPAAVLLLTDEPARRSTSSRQTRKNGGTPRFIGNIECRVDIPDTTLGSNLSDMPSPASATSDGSSGSSSSSRSTCSEYFPSGSESSGSDDSEESSDLLEEGDSLDETTSSESDDSDSESDDSDFESDDSDCWTESSRSDSDEGLEESGEDEEAEDGFRASTSSSNRLGTESCDNEDDGELDELEEDENEDPDSVSDTLTRVQIESDECDELEDNGQPALGGGNSVPQVDDNDDSEEHDELEDDTDLFVPSRAATDNDISRVAPHIDAGVISPAKSACDRVPIASTPVEVKYESSDARLTQRRNYRCSEATEGTPWTPDGIPETNHGGLRLWFQAPKLEQISDAAVC
ncbi:hypothetical protein B0H15DRAFT_455409 [Mycena belliarum]|uniref:Uncharacterized protein n=1 Tax=Mycena belliarum TaxID=1033014 RepID=A0AAD6UL67_9AGAR|nr:hypothetical protein B0H15DRAFT_455409 [Mycena belliae]